MRASFIFYLFLCINIGLIGNDKPIPTKLTKKLVLKPKKTPYLITSLTVEKTGTLVLMPGVKLAGSAKGSTGQFYVYGKIIAGSKKSKRKVEIINMAHLVFSGADINISNAVLAGGYMKFLGDCKGALTKTKLTRSTNSIVHPIRLNVPKSGKLNFVSCEIFNLDIDLQSKNFPADIPNMSFIKCAFMTPAMTGKNANRPYVVRTMPLEMLAYGNQCDILMKLKFSALNWKLKPTLIRQWYFYDKSTRETAKNTAASNKTFILKMGKKPLTKFRAEAVEKKGKKKR
ncbi:MAG: hypothetical protein COA79_08435 [Planctomycetota bacterium]|nr:MAG: hypothetical protein COA79_08435 [Planctomycetota bacterium]